MGQLVGLSDPVGQYDPAVHTSPYDWPVGLASIAPRLQEYPSKQSPDGAVKPTATQVLAITNNNYH